MTQLKYDKEGNSTLVVTNFSGRLTRYRNGDINSGLARQDTTTSINTFQQPQNLMFMEQQTQIDPTAEIITDCIVAGQARIETNVTYLYAIGHTGRFYKIQVNNPSTENPNYDTPILLTTLTNGQTFQYGSSFVITTGTSTPAQAWIGHDNGVTRINLDGTSETVIGSTGSTTWIASMPRFILNFGGFLYVTNGNNLGQISPSSSSINSYAILQTGLPTNIVIRDLKTTSDGIYIVMVCSSIPPFNMFSTNQDTSESGATTSSVDYWNGTDSFITSTIGYPSFNQTSYYSFAQTEYLFGYDIAGGVLQTPTAKILSLIQQQSPMPNAVNSNGNFVGWMTPGFDQGFQKAMLYLYGSLDDEVPVGFYRQFKMAATSPQTDIIKVPFTILVNNFGFASSFAGYQGDVQSCGKMYISTIEYNGTTFAYRFYSLFNVPIGINASAAGVYETQAELFSKSVKATEIRVYMENATSNQGFQVDIIGINGNPITQYSSANATNSASFSSIASGTTLLQYNPSAPPTTAIGLRITNTGTVTPIIHKVEIDIAQFGK
jgi:hypothetical protein